VNEIFGSWESDGEPLLPDLKGVTLMELHGRGRKDKTAVNFDAARAEDVQLSLRNEGE
jgi:hypothetical protein